MPCVDIHHAGHYQLEMVFVHAHLPPIAMGNKSACYKNWNGNGNETKRNRNCACATIDF